MGALDGKIAIITGAGSGIGRASALRFAAEGAKLVLGDKTAAVHDTAKAVRDAGGEAVALEIDAGVEAVQLFDSWAGSLAPLQFDRCSFQCRTLIDNEGPILR